MHLNELPSEILAVIGSYCTQADIVNLAIACPIVSQAVLPGVYQCIVINPVPRALFGIRNLKKITMSHGESIVPVSTVHTIAGIKQLLDTLARKKTYASMVRSFSVKGNVAMSDNDLIPRVRKVVRNLSMLSEFQWTACPELPPDLLTELPHDAMGVNSELTSLRVDIATRPGQTYPRIKLPNLRRMHIRPFLDDHVLSWLHTVVADSVDLEEIKLNRFLDTKPEVGSSFAFVGLSDIHQQHELCAASTIFFQNNLVRHHLRCLELTQIDTCDTDARNLERSVDLPALKVLKLVGSGREDEYNHGLLSCIVKACPQLERAYIDWNASHSTMLAFLTNCCRSVRTLHVTVKELPFRILDCLQRTCPHVENLEIHMQCDFSLADFQPLSKLSRLRVLKLPFNYKVNSWEAALALPSLKVIELIWAARSASSSYLNDHGLRSQSRAVNLGLLTSGLLDQWNDLHRSPLQGANILEAARTNRSLEYVVVDGNVTPLKTGIPSLESYRM